MGAGVHGLNGVGPQVAMMQYNTYVVPTMLYGLEVLILTPSEIASRQPTAHHTPSSIDSNRCHLIIGAPPAEALIDIKTLTLFGNIFSPQNK